ncbi:hypothetical protein L204_103852 [Cryptococcus depauperatus]
MSTKVVDSHLQLDPSLIALAAQVQAHAYAQRQPSTASSADDNGSNSARASSSEVIAGQALGSEVEHQTVEAGPAPSLLDIERVVNGVGRGKRNLDQGNGHSQSEQAQSNQDRNNPHATGELPQREREQANPHECEMEESHDVQLDDEIDPTLREIVNSLTNAQQSNLNGIAVPHAQVAAIGAHLVDVEERERLQHSLQTTLEDLAHGNFNSLFPPNFQSLGHNFLNLNDHDSLQNSPDAALSNSSLEMDAEAGPSSEPMQSSISEHDVSQVPSFAHPMKRGRGRPKGSKNKPKPGPSIIRPPKPPKPPSRPKGRPPKERTPAEQAEYELRKQEKEMGIKRQKGRPRKFPGYLVREMRLKKNRDEFNKVIRIHEEKKKMELVELQIDAVTNLAGSSSMLAQEQAIHESSLNDHGNHFDHSHHHEHDYPNWSVQDDQTLLDVVGVEETDMGTKAWRRFLALEGRAWNSSARRHTRRKRCNSCIHVKLAVSILYLLGDDSACSAMMFCLRDIESVDKIAKKALVECRFYTSRNHQSLTANTISSLHNPSLNACEFKVIDEFIVTLLEEVPDIQIGVQNARSQERNVEGRHER